jgi:hypothetical protein
VGLDGCRIAIQGDRRCKRPLIQGSSRPVILRARLTNPL